MKKLIGAITIGQSPRVDATPEMMAVMPPNTELIEAGALDGLSRATIDTFAPQEGEYVLVSRLRDGDHVVFAKRHILPRLQACIEELENKGAAVIVFICTGEFPADFTCRVPLIYPQKLLHAVTPTLCHRGRVGVLMPEAAQIPQGKARWGEMMSFAAVDSANPYHGDLAEVAEAALRLKAQDVDLIVLDCIGYTEAMRQAAAEATGLPVILPRTLVGRILAEMIG